ncbi:hypothetical protein CASFOL_009426 [Castilleja foliolosa]|uniref:Uncharacterized protein n=1 Tax=Castilleja foliolosa TaxID=1961234 RepID=A0ABD3DZ96_9LAMI
MREVREIQEMESRKADDMRSEIEELRKTLEELRRHKNYASFEEDYVAFEKQPPPSPTEQTPPPLLPQNTPSPPAPTDDAYVPFDDDFVDEIIAFADKQDYVRHRSIRLRTNKHMIAYLAYLKSDPKEKREVGHGILFEMPVFSNELKTLPSGWRHRRLNAPADIAFISRICRVSSRRQWEICGFGLIFR